MTRLMSLIAVSNRSGLEAEAKAGRGSWAACPSYGHFSPAGPAPSVKTRDPSGPDTTGAGPGQ